MSVVNGPNVQMSRNQTADRHYIQKDTFTNWVNEQLRSQGKQIVDLYKDLADGVLLVDLVESLQKRHLSGVVATPKHKKERLKNIRVVLQAAASDNVRISNIDGNDVVEGNSKTIQNMIWQLILRYHIASLKDQHSRWLLSWLQAVLPECYLSNLTTDWNDGSALFALLDFCRPGLYPNWKLCDKSDRYGNCLKAIKIANQEFAIPQVLRPDHMSSADLDEMSTMTYLSYFVTPGGPGYNETLRRLQPLVKDAPLNNFCTDWNDGKLLCEIVSNIGIDIQNLSSSNATATDLIRQGMAAASKHLHVEPVVTAAEMAEERLDHIGVMAYASRFIRFSPACGLSDSFWPQSQGSEKLVVIQRQNVSTGSSLKSDPNSLPNMDRSMKLISRTVDHTERVYLTNQAVYVTHKSPEMLKNDNKISTLHEERMYSLMNAKPNDVPQRSFSFVRTPSLRKAKSPVTHSDDEDDVKIDTFSVGAIINEKTYSVESRDSVRLEATSPTGRLIKMTGDGFYNAQFAADEIGTWRVRLYCNDKLANTCPIDVCDPSQVKVMGLKPGVVGKRQEFKIDCSKAGPGEVEVLVKHRKKEIPCYITEDSPNVYVAKFTPYHHGTYHIGVSYNKAEIRDADYLIAEGEGMHRRAVFRTDIEEDTDGAMIIASSCDWQVDYVTGGPLEVKMSDRMDIKVYSMQDGSICSFPHLIADCSDVPEGSLKAEVEYGGFRFSADVEEQKTDIYRISFRPRGAGTYRIWVTYDGSIVKGSPFIQEIDELTSPSLTGEGLLRGIQGSPCIFYIDARGFPGQMTVAIKGPTKPIDCSIQEKADGTHTVTYIPQENGTHWIHIQLDGKEIKGSPYKPRVVNPNMVIASGEWVRLLSDNHHIPLVVNKEKQLPFDAQNAGPGEMTAEVHDSEGASVPVTIDSRKGARHTVIFTPREEGEHMIDIRWNGFPLPHTPYVGLAQYRPDLEVKPPYQSIVLLRNPKHRHNSDSDSDTTDDGSGGRKRIVIRRAPSAVDGAIVRKPDAKPSQKLHRHKSDVTHLQPSIIVKNAPEKNHHLSSPNIWDEGEPPKGPKVSSLYVPNNAPHISDSDPYQNPPKVVLSGPGLKKAYVNKPAVFYIDGRQAPHGKPEIVLSNVNDQIPVEAQPNGFQKYTCTYVPQEPGVHFLNIKWNQRPLKCCPLKIDVSGPWQGDSSPQVSPRVIPLGSDTPISEKLREVTVGKPIVLRINPKPMGPGELRVDCIGPKGENLPVITSPHDDGTIGVQLRPIGPGRHILNVRYNEKHIFDSPYAIDVQVNRTYGPVTVYGPGVQNGVLPFDGQFWVDARKAGTGELYVSVMGPKGAFRVEMHRQSQKTKLFDCRYHPVEPGVYTVNVLWSGEHVSDSPYTVVVGLSQEDLSMNTTPRRGSMQPLPRPSTLSYDQWSAAGSAPLMY